MRSRDPGHHDQPGESAGAGFELPPGATFEPDPQVALKQPQDGNRAP
jgi:putative (di)nucleoside polyphosphate hydrolase